MTLSTAANKVIHNGNASATSFPFSFPVYAATDLSVIYTDAGGNALTLSPSLYSLTGIGSLTGGAVTYPLSGSPLAFGETLTILRTVPLTQLTVLSNQGGYYPEVVERRLDYVYMALQQLAEQIGRVTLDPPSVQVADVVETMAALKAMTTRPAAVLAKGRNAAADGWGGVFAWVGGSTTPADDGLVVECTTGDAGRYKRIFDGPLHSKWFAIGDGVTDDTAGLNTFFAHATAGRPVHVDDGTYKITAALTAITGDAVRISGDGRGAVIKYTNGAATTATPMTIGDGSPFDRAQVSGFTIESATVMAGGSYGIHIRNYAHVDFDVWCGDEYSEGWKLHVGAWFDACSVVNLHTSHFYGSAKNLLWSGPAVELHCQGAFVKGFNSSGGTGIGIHIGGGCGGFNGEDLTQLLNDIGVLVDTSITGTANSQIFMGNAELDTNKTASVRINDALGTSLFYSQDDAWLASTSAGVGLDIVNWLNGKVRIGGGRIYNCSADGVKIADNSIDLRVTDDSIIESNAGFGINSTVAISLVSSGRLANNGSGNYHSNVTPTDGNGFSSRTLGFYDQGTWTPAFAGGTTPGAPTYTARTGYYTRIGNRVTVDFRVVINAIDGAAAGNFRITGLPFAALTDGNMTWGGFVSAANIITHAAFSQFALGIPTGATYADLYEFGVPSVSGGAAIVPITAAANGCSIAGTITYRIA